MMPTASPSTNADRLPGRGGPRRSATTLPTPNWLAITTMPRQKKMMMSVRQVPASGDQPEGISRLHRGDREDQLSNRERQRGQQDQQGYEGKWWRLAWTWDHDQPGGTQDHQQHDRNNHERGQQQSQDPQDRGQPCESPCDRASNRDRRPDRQAVQRNLSGETQQHHHCVGQPRQQVRLRPDRRADDRENHLGEDDQSQRHRRKQLAVATEDRPGFLPGLRDRQAAHLRILPLLPRLCGAVADRATLALSSGGRHFRWHGRHSGRHRMAS